MFNLKKTFTLALLTAMFVWTGNLAHARILFQNEFLIESDGVNTWVIDSQDNAAGNDVVLQFGNTLAQTIHFDLANDWFEFGNDVAVFGSGLIENTNVGQSFRVNDDTNDTTPFLIDQDGNVGIQNGAPAAPLDVERNGQAVELGDGTANDVTLTFDDGTDRNITWNATDLRFDLSEDLNVDGNVSLTGNLDMNLGQAVELRAENLAGAPACDAGSTGRVYQNTTDDNTYVCDGSTYQSMNNQGVTTTHYHNGAEVTNLITATRDDVVTTGGETVIYLTDDGTNTGTLLFTDVYHVSVSASTIQTDSEAPAMHGYSYNSVTGALTIKFLESATVVLGLQGLEAEEAATPFTVFVVGV